LIFKPVSHVVCLTIIGAYLLLMLNCNFMEITDIFEGSILSKIVFLIWRKHNAYLPSIIVLIFGVTRKLEQQLKQTYDVK